MISIPNEILQYAHFSVSATESVIVGQYSHTHSPQKNHMSQSEYGISFKASVNRCVAHCIVKKK